MIIAIDGPAGAGKSTTARGVARRLGYGYLDTGAMYRAVALACLRNETDLEASSVQRLLTETQVRTRWTEEGMEVLLDGSVVEEELRTPEVTEIVSRVSAMAPVREYLVDLQRRAGRRSEDTLGGAVAEGRDIGTVVFPEADVKIFLVADAEERARRRYRELEADGADVTFEETVAAIEERDRQDTEREIAPLRKAEDAVEVDTTGLSIDDQIEKVAKIARERAER